MPPRTCNVRKCEESTAICSARAASDFPDSLEPEGAVPEHPVIGEPHVGIMEGEGGGPVELRQRSDEIPAPSDRERVGRTFTRAVTVLEFLHRAREVVGVEHDRGEDPALVVDLTEAEDRDVEAVGADEPVPADLQSLPSRGEHLVENDLVEHLDETGRGPEELLACGGRSERHGAAIHRLEARREERSQALRVGGVGQRHHLGEPTRRPVPDAWY